MFYFLFLKVCLLSAALAKLALAKYKRDILPGGSRYGTDYRNNILHAQEQNHENDIEISKPVDGYAGSYIIQEGIVNQNFINLKNSLSNGPLNFTPGRPIESAQEPQVQPVQQVRQV